MPVRQPETAVMCSGATPATPWRRPPQAVTLPCGSISSKATFLLCPAQATAKVIAKVVLPAPPFCCATVTMRAVMGGL